MQKQLKPVEKNWKNKFIQRSNFRETAEFNDRFIFPNFHSSLTPSHWHKNTFLFQKRSKENYHMPLSHFFPSPKENRENTTPHLLACHLSGNKSNIQTKKKLQLLSFNKKVFCNEVRPVIKLSKMSRAACNAIPRLVTGSPELTGCWEKLMKKKAWQYHKK